MTREEVLAKAAEWEAAGNMANAAKLRAHAATMPDTKVAPDAAAIEAKAKEWEAAGRPENAAKLRAHAATIAPAAPAAPAVPAAEPAIAAPPPRADPQADKQRKIDNFAAFEMANPMLAGRYTPETMPKPGDSVPGQGGGGKSGGNRYTVQPWQNVKADTFGDTARAMVEGPMAAAGEFAGGLTGANDSPSRAYLANDPLTAGLPDFALTGLGMAGDAAGAAMSTVGAGIRGAIGLGTEMVPGQTAADERKLGEDLSAMTMFVAPELAGVSSIIGKSAPGVTKITVPKIGGKPWQNAFGASEARPSIESLRAAKNLAYKAVDDAGETFDVPAMTALRDRVNAALAEGNYVSGVDSQTDAVVSLLERKAGQEMSLGQLDKLRQEFYKRLAAAPNEVGIRDAIDAIDEMILGKAEASELMDAARLSNSRYKKAELLDLAFQKAKDQTAATGSGGNILNKFRQAVVSIIDNPKNAKWFNKDEIATMRGFVEGTNGQNAMRLVGKLSPNGNGLMMALNLAGAGATGGASLWLTGGAVLAKAVADRGAIKGADALIGKVAGDKPPAPKPAAKPGATIPVPVIPGAAQSTADEYEPLWQRYGR